MPELNGYEATKAIRKKQQGHKDQTVIIGLSAHSNPEYKTLAFEAGMDDFITKPLTIENIEEIMEKINKGFYKKESYSDDADFIDLADDLS